MQTLQYISGQLERGEKIAAALNVSLSTLFEKLGGQEKDGRDIPLECYEFLSAKTKGEQEFDSKSRNN